MNACHKVEEQIQKYLEDLLPESERSEIRKHLADCHKCALFLQELGSFTSDLRHSAFASLPPGQLEALLKEVEKRETFPWRRVMNYFKKALFVTVAASALLFSIRGIQAWEKHLNEEKKKMLEEQMAGSAVIKQLKSIDDRLSRYGKKSKEDAGQTKPAQSVVSLHPFHWHLDFDSGASRDRYLDKLRKEGAKFLYLSKETPVVEFDYEEFLVLAKETPAFSGILSKGTLVNFEELPVSRNPVEISFYFRYPDRVSKLHHWHLKFSLPNRFTFEGQAKADFKFLFAEQDLWIVNVNSDEYIHLVQMIQEVQGAEVDWGEEGENPAKSNIRVPVMIVLSGG